jgi:hypothetical protein
MKNIFLTAMLIATLSGDVINGIAITVNGVPITNFDIQTAQNELSVPREKAIKVLIQSALEEFEVKKLGIEASQQDIDRFISNLMTQNRVPTKEAFFKALEYRGVSKEEFIEGVKREAVKPKLYQRVSSHKLAQPTEEQLQEIYLADQTSWRVANSYDVTVYASRDIRAIREQLSNPLMFNRSVTMERVTITAQDVSPEIRSLLSKVEQGSFSEIIPMGGVYRLFYVNSKDGERTLEFNEVVDQIRTSEMIKQQQKIVESYFEKIRAEAVIEYK